MASEINLFSCVVDDEETEKRGDSAVWWCSLLSEDGKKLLMPETEMHVDACNYDWYFTVTSSFVLAFAHTDILGMSDV